MKGEAGDMCARGSSGVFLAEILPVKLTQISHILRAHTSPTSPAQITPGTTLSVPSHVQIFSYIIYKA